MALYKSKKKTGKVLRSYNLGVHKDKGKKSKAKGKGKMNLKRAC